MARMSERRFHCPDLSVGVVNLPETEAHHARTVLRLKPGQTATLFDGVGRYAEGTIASVERDGVQVRVDLVATVGADQRPLPVTLAVAMPKASRQDVLIEKCTELGAAAIWPVLTERSVVRPKAGRVEHWKRVAVAAAKQSGRLTLPRIVSPVPFEELLAESAKFDVRVFGATGSDAAPLLDRLAEFGQPGSILILIGPEGGLSDTEHQALTNADAQPVRLGAFTLRTETAAIAAVAQIAACIKG